MLQWNEEIQTLLDIEAIKQLQYIYAEICDDNHNPNRICSVFTEDAIWDGGEQLGRYSGHAQIREAFIGFSNSIDFSSHHMTNPIITINGHSATGRWYMIGLFQRDGKASFGTVKYSIEYEKTSEKWLIKRLSARPTNYIDL